MIYLPLALQTIAGMVLTFVLAKVAPSFIFENGGISNSTVLILSPILGGAGAALIGFLQYRRQVKADNVAERKQDSEIATKAAGVDVDERKDARNALVKVIEQQAADHERDREGYRQQREEMSRFYMEQIDAQRVTIKQRDSVIEMQTTLLNQYRTPVGTGPSDSARTS